MRCHRYNLHLIFVFMIKIGAVACKKGDWKVRILHPVGAVYLILAISYVLIIESIKTIKEIINDVVTLW